MRKRWVVFGSRSSNSDGPLDQATFATPSPPAAPIVVRVGYHDSLNRLPSTMPAQRLAIASRPRVGCAWLAPNAALASMCEANAAAS